MWSTYIVLALDVVGDLCVSLAGATECRIVRAPSARHRLE